MPQTSQSPKPGSWRSATAGYYHSLALKADGTALAWGSSGYGQSTVPTNLSGVIALAGGYAYNLALKAQSPSGGGTLRLAMLPPGTNGLPQLELTGPAGYAYLVEGSTNLVDWAPRVLLVNSNGTTRFVDPGETITLRRFYRAVTQ